MKQQLHTNPDSLLIIGLKEGREAIFEDIFKQFYAGLCVYAKKYVYEQEIAEEIVQHLFCRLWEKREHLEIKGSIKAYLFNATRNNCLSHLRHEKIKNNYQQEVITSHTEKDPEFNDTLQEAELSQLIQKTIGELPEQCRKIFLMSREEGLKYKEIAAQLGLSQKTVEAQMGKALKRIRKVLEAYLTIILILLFTH